MKLARYSKALIAAGGAVAVTALAIHRGMDPEAIPAMTEAVVTAVIGLLMTLGVWAIPNDEGE